MAIRIIRNNINPITLDEAKLNLRVDHDDEDSLIQRLITSATYTAENFCSRLLMAASVEQSFQILSHRVELQYNTLGKPVIEYRDENGDIQTIDPTTYYHRNESGYGALYLKSGESWPQADQDTSEPYTIKYDAGISSDRKDIPEDIKSAIHLMVARMYAHREDHIKRLPSASESLLHYHRNTFV